MDYEEYLKSDQWKKLIEEAYVKAGGSCSLCWGKPEAVHHIKYPKDLKDDDLDNLIAVCKRCHDILHGIPTKEEKSNGEYVSAEKLGNYAKIKKMMEYKFHYLDLQAKMIEPQLDELARIDEISGSQHNIKQTKTYLLLRQKWGLIKETQGFIAETGVLRGD